MADTGLTYHDFERTYLALARHLLDSSSASGRPHELCRHVYDSLSAEERENYDIVCAHFKGHPYRERIVEQERERERIFDLLLGNIVSSTDCDISVPELLTLVVPVLRHLTLFDRAILALRIQGWGHDAIAAAINHSIGCLGQVLTELETLHKVADAIESFRNSLLVAISEHDRDSKWAQTVLATPTIADFDTWRPLNEFSLRNSETRFARAGSADLYAKLRDRSAKAIGLVRKSVLPALQKRANPTRATHE